MLESMRKLWKDEAGPTSVEYALLLALVSLVALAAWFALGGSVKTTADASATAMGSVGTPAPLGP